MDDGLLARAIRMRESTRKNFVEFKEGLKAWLKTE